MITFKLSLVATLIHSQNTLILHTFVLSYIDTQTHTYNIHTHTQKCTHTHTHTHTHLFSLTQTHTDTHTHTKVQDAYPHTQYIQSCIHSSYWIKHLPNCINFAFHRNDTLNNIIMSINLSGCRINKHCY